MRVLSYLLGAVLGAISLSCFLSGAGHAAVVDANLNLVSPSGSTNQTTMTVRIQTLGYDKTDSDTATISGNMLTKLTAEFDPNNQEITSLTGLEFYGGVFSLSPVSLYYQFKDPFFGTTVATLSMSGSGIGGSFDTPSPPAAVTSGTFQASDHEAILNQGNLQVTGTGLLNSVNQAFDLASNPVSGTSSGTGSVSASLASIVGNVATYNVSLSIPLSIDQDIDTSELPVTADVHVSAAGTIVATGTFSRTFTIPVEPPDPPVVTLGIVDKGSEGGLHKYVLTATGQGITTLSQFTVSGAVHQVFHDGEPSEWRGDGSALASDKTDSHVIFGDSRLPDLGGLTWDDITYPDGPPDKITQEIIYGGGNSGMGRLNNYNAESEWYDAYLKEGPPSTNSNDVYELMQLVVKEGDGFTADVTLLTSIEHDPVTGHSYIHKHNLRYILPGPQTLIWPGDANNDYYVDELDAQALAEHWLQSGGWADGDFNNDGMVNDLDAVILAANWTGSPSASVPEPGVLALLAGALCFVLLRKRN